MATRPRPSGVSIGADRLVNLVGNQLQAIPKGTEQVTLPVYEVS